ncbi:hypothetical protein L484_016355 [Morus notabilis]|uniref:Uncharacterized protein n=1 Tax=Morus notabilis TaxID=981085 RepID=W9QZK6_9ROSA|nr:hypothetical protein L484_016355 [Morus notabilis]
MVVARAPSGRQSSSSTANLAKLRCLSNRERCCSRTKLRNARKQRSTEPSMSRRQSPPWLIDDRPICYLNVGKGGQKQGERGEERRSGICA